MRIRIRGGKWFTPAPTLVPEPVREVSSVAVHGDEHAGLRPVLQVREGDAVHAGQALFNDRVDPDVLFVAPAAGRISQIRLGPRRRLQSVVIDTPGRVAPDWPLSEPVAGMDALAAMPLGQLREGLLRSGLWTAIRQRPGDRCAPSAGYADVVLVTAIDTEPGAVPMESALADRWDAFWLGVAAVARFCRHATWVCTAPGFPLMPRSLAGKARPAVFTGPHPAGLAGTHIAHLAPLAPGRTAWHIGGQDVAAIGLYLMTGSVPCCRRIAVSGAERPPRLLDAPLGSRLADLVPEAAGNRLISGSWLHGRVARAPFEHLARFHHQVTLLPQNGAPPLSAADGLCPHDGLERHWGLPAPAIPLLRALMTGDDQAARSLGCLDLGEEDLALATLYSGSGHRFAPYLREALERLRREDGA